MSMDAAEALALQWLASARAPEPELADRVDRFLVTRSDRDPHSVEAQAIFDCPPQAVFELLTDFSALPRHIYGLQAADLVDQRGSSHTVRFVMRLPFPVGRLEWSNHVSIHRRGPNYSIAWTLAGGDLAANTGRLLLSPYQGAVPRTYAFYRVEVQTRSRLPRSAQSLATRWLLPRIVAQLRTAAEDRQVGRRG